MLVFGFFAPLATAKPEAWPIAFGQHVKMFNMISLLFEGQIKLVHVQYSANETDVHSCEYHVHARGKSGDTWVVTQILRPLSTTFTILRTRENKDGNKVVYEAAIDMSASDTRGTSVLQDAAYTFFGGMLNAFMNDCREQNGGIARNP